MKSPRLLGISASHRSPRQESGQSALTRELQSLPDKNALMDYIRQQGKLCLESYLEAGRKQEASFFTIYKNLRKVSMNAGLSNSDLALAAALWSAAELGAQVKYLPLAAHFDVDGSLNASQSLRDALLWADGIIISGPVYFGDRSSRVKSLQDFILSDPELLQDLRGKLYSGIAVGAKRNGGQETTLIYQLVDMLDMGMLGVGNDSDTTAQYGGTCHAGDVGTVAHDQYGLDTSMGVGRRMAKVMNLLDGSRRLAEKPKALVLLLQEADGIGSRFISHLAETLHNDISIDVVDVTCEKIKPCMACDICPSKSDLDEQYSCLVKNDSMHKFHARFLDADMIVPIVLSARNPARTKGDYQIFMERTRYLRRGDYIWSDALVVPIMLQETGGVSTYPLRMLTSFIRHHTVMSKPLVGHLHEGNILDVAGIIDGLREASLHAARLAAGRLANAGTAGKRGYNPVGYVLSVDKTREDRLLPKREQIVDERIRRLSRQAESRLSPAQGDS